MAVVNPLATRTCSSSYQLQLISSLREYFVGGDLSDIVFEVGTRKFPAHRLILCAASEYFRKLLRESVGSKTFVKATLSQNKGDEKTLTNVYMRLVELKSGVNLQVKLRHKTNDVTKNFPVAEVAAKQAAASVSARLSYGLGNALTCACGTDRCRRARPSARWIPAGISLH